MKIQIISYERRKYGSFRKKYIYNLNIYKVSIKY